MLEPTFSQQVANTCYHINTRQKNNYNQNEFVNLLREGVCKSRKAPRLLSKTNYFRELL